MENEKINVQQYEAVKAVYAVVFNKKGTQEYHSTVFYINYDVMTKRMKSYIKENNGIIYPYSCKLHTAGDEIYNLLKHSGSAIVDRSNVV